MVVIYVLSPPPIHKHTNLTKLPCLHWCWSRSRRPVPQPVPEPAPAPAPALELEPTVALATEPVPAPAPALAPAPSPAPAPTLAGYFQKIVCLWMGGGDWSTKFVCPFMEAFRVKELWAFCRIKVD